MRSDELHAEDVTGNVSNLLRRMSQLDAASLAAATGVDLRFDDANVGFQTLGSLERFFLSESNFAAGSSDAITREYRFGLVLVNFHEGSVLPFRLETVSQC